MINESNITNDERQYRNFVNLVKSYKPSVDIEKVKVAQTTKGNWRVYGDDKKPICLVSKAFLSKEIADAHNLVCTGEC